MHIEPLQILVFALSVLGWMLGYWRWVRPWRKHGVQSQAMLAMIAIVCLGGFWGAFFWWFPQTGIFGWKLPLLASRMLSGAGWAFALVAFTALRTPRAATVRFALVWLAVYLWPLAIAAPALHLDRFDFSQVIVYAFFIVVIGLSVGATWFLVRQPWPLADNSDQAKPVDGATAAWFGLVAIVMAAWSLALFVTDQGPSPAVWIWPGDALTTRLIAAMLLTIAAGCVVARRDATLAPMMHGAIAIYGATAVLANAINALAARPHKLAYIVAFGLMAVGSLVLLVRGRPAAG